MWVSGREMAVVTEDVDVLFFEHGGFWCGPVRCGADVVFVLKSFGC